MPIFETRAHLIETPKTYTVTFTKGSKWVYEIPYKKQKFVGEQIIFIKNLFRDKKILLAGAYDNAGTTFVVFQDMKAKDLRRILDKSPAVKNKVLKYEMKEFALTMLGKPQDHQH